MDAYRRLLELLPALHACATQDAVTRMLTREISSVIWSDLVSLNVISTGPSGTTTIGMFDQDWADPREIEPFFDRYAHQHPLIQVFTSGESKAPLRMSDHTDMEAFRRTELYQTVFVPLRSLHQLGLAVVAIPGTIVGIGINRTHEDFTDEEMEVARVLWEQLPAVLEHVNLRALHREATAIEGASDLTERERQIMLHVRAGRSNQQIAEAMLLGRRTVEKHLERVYQRLGVRSRSAAVHSLWPGEDV